MKWLKKILGFNDKKQAQQAEEISNYVHDKRNEFTSTMIKAHQEARENHKKARQTKRNSIKIDKRVQDVARQIYQVTAIRLNG